MFAVLFSSVNFANHHRSWKSAIFLLLVWSWPTDLESVSPWDTNLFQITSTTVGLIFTQ